MSSRASISIDTSKFKEKYTKYISSVKDTLAEEWETVAIECLSDVASRAPDPATEYSHIQGITGGSKEDPKDLKNPSAERISFIRSPGMWLKQLIMDPSTYSINPGNLTMSLGKVEALENGSAFSWQNFSSKLGTMLHNSLEAPHPYGVFSFFEYGKETTQVAKFGKYKLKDATSEFWASHKSYPRMGMYTFFNRQVFHNAVKAVTSKIKF